jgi:hypothetical protein
MTIGECQSHQRPVRRQALALVRVKFGHHTFPNPVTSSSLSGDAPLLLEGLQVRSLSFLPYLNETTISDWYISSKSRLQGGRSSFLVSQCGRVVGLPTALWVMCVPSHIFVGKMFYDLNLPYEPSDLTSVKERVMVAVKREYTALFFL